MAVVPNDVSPSVDTRPVESKELLQDSPNDKEDVLFSSGIVDLCLCLPARIEDRLKLKSSTDCCVEISPSGIFLNLNLPLMTEFGMKPGVNIIRMYKSYCTSIQHVRIYCFLLYV